MDTRALREATQLLKDMGAGDRSAVDRFLPLVYKEMRRIASSQLKREQPGHTLQATALVHEAYLKLIDQRVVTWQSRGHFLGVAARLMRYILMDHAKGRRVQKRGGEMHQTIFDEERMVVFTEASSELIALDAALTRLEALDEQQAKIVELRFFGGLTVEETAEAIGKSPATVKREWQMAKAWLYEEIRKQQS